MWIEKDVEHKLEKTCLNVNAEGLNNGNVAGYSTLSSMSSVKEIGAFKGRGKLAK